MAHELDVWLFADRIGTLALVDGRLYFCYAPGWLSYKDAVALSASLLLQAQPFDDRKTRPFDGHRSTPLSFSTFTAVRKRTGLHVASAPR